MQEYSTFRLPILLLIFISFKFGTYAPCSEPVEHRPQGFSFAEKSSFNSPDNYRDHVLPVRRNEALVIMGGWSSFGEWL